VKSKDAAVWSARLHQLHDRVQKGSWSFLWQVATGVRNLAVCPGAAELRRNRRTIACRLLPLDRASEVIAGMAMISCAASLRSISS